MSCIDTSHEGEVRSDSTVHGMLHQLFAGTELEYPRIVAGPEAALEQFCEIDVLRGLNASRVMTTDHALALHIDGNIEITGLTRSRSNQRRVV